MYVLRHGWECMGHYIYKGRHREDFERGPPSGAWEDLAGEDSRKSCLASKEYCYKQQQRVLLVVGTR